MRRVFAYQNQTPVFGEIDTEGFNSGEGSDSKRKHSNGPHFESFDVDIAKEKVMKWYQTGEQ